MFSINGVGAYFLYMSGYFYTRLCEFLAGDMVVRTILATSFGVLFLVTIVQYFSRKTGATILPHGYVGIGTVFKVIASYLIGVALLSPRTTVDIKGFDRESYSENQYVIKRLQETDPEIKLGLLTALMVQSSEEVSWVMTKLVDKVMGGTHEYATAPNLYYKAMMLSAASRIETPELRNLLEVYTIDCIQPLLPIIKEERGAGKMFAAISLNDRFSSELSKISTVHGRSCNEVRQYIQDGLAREISESGGHIDRLFSNMSLPTNVSMDHVTNFNIANKLVNYNREKAEGALGVMKGSEVAGWYGWFFQNMGKLFSIEGLWKLNGRNDLAGAGAALDRANEFNEQLRTAPMLQGMLRGGLIVFSALFPFFIVFLKWRIILWTWIVYLSVCLWTPVWAALYKLVGALFSTPALLERFGSIDTLSAYSALQVNDQVYYSAQIIYWLSVIAGPGITGAVGFFGAQWFMAAREDHMPVPVHQAVNTVASGAMLGRTLG